MREGKDSGDDEEASLSIIRSNSESDVESSFRDTMLKSAREFIDEIKVSFSQLLIHFLSEGLLFSLAATIPPISASLLKLQFLFNRNPSAYHREKVGDKLVDPPKLSDAKIPSFLQESIRN
ncbi:hypothetical protein TrST_g10518 [Triparma strigata]|uniref:Uncharacterized protein n=1 Tax=Triparma strigata TaxID=1606541 RepID=A0A9W6ZLA7_9STRA|nr:hypothetical protein TrST_g10518 [Triparma strigata]